MTKLKSPLLSLEAKGGLAGHLSYDNRSNSPRVRRKPIPTNPRSLPQLYQRWDYLDYLHLWNALTSSQKATWLSDARPFHITGLNLFMKTRLNALTNLILRYRFDYTHGAFCLDSSRNGHTGTILGAFPISSRILNGYYFDGVDDKVTIPHVSTLDITGSLTIQAFIAVTDDGRTHHIVIAKRLGASSNYQLTLKRTAATTYTPGFYCNNGGSIYSTVAVTPVNNELHHYSVVLDVIANTITFYYDGEQLGAIQAYANSPTANTHPLLIAWDSGAARLYGRLDHLEVNDRPLDPVEVKAHSLRQYPLRNTPN